MTNDELAAIAARAWGIVRASTTPEIGVVAVHALQARIEGALREQATAAAERERVLREALRWTAATLQALTQNTAHQNDTITMEGETRTIGAVLDAADAALEAAS